MKSTKSTAYLRKPITTRKINSLVKKALANYFKAEPQKGYKYLRDIKPGLIFLTESGMKGVYLESTPTSAKVIITSCKHINEDDRAYYLGKQNISNRTEVKICG